RGARPRGRKRSGRLVGSGAGTERDVRQRYSGRTERQHVRRGGLAFFLFNLVDLPVGQGLRSGDDVRDVGIDIAGTPVLARLLPLLILPPSELLLTPLGQRFFPLTFGCSWS